MGQGAPMMQATTVRTQAIADVEIEIEIESEIDEVDAQLDREIEAILEDLTEHVVADVRRTDRYRCVARSSAP